MKMLKVKDIPQELYTTACCLWDYNTDMMLAGPDYKGFSPSTLDNYGNHVVYCMEHETRENSDGELERYLDVYVKRGEQNAGSKILYAL